MKTDLPTIDVVIPVYNGEAYVKEALDSVLAQSLQPTKILVIDDGSTDGTRMVVESIAKTSPIVVYIHKSNGGLSSARNAGIKQSKAPYLAFLDADDTWEPTKLERQWEVFRRSTDSLLGVVYCDYFIIDETGKRRNDIPTFPLNRQISGNIFMRLLDGNQVISSGSGVLVKRDCFASAGLFDEALSTNEDWDMWLRIARSFHYDFVPDKLVGIRRHLSNMSRQSTTMQLGTINVLNKWSDILAKERRLFGAYGVRPIVPFVLTLLRYWNDRPFIRKIGKTMSPALKRHFLIHLIPAFLEAAGRWAARSLKLETR